MARTVWNNGDGETYLRRFNPRGPPYSISHDRYLSNLPTSDDGDAHEYSGRGYPGQHENTHDVESEQESQKAVNTRRRIPVACGRCRKRKIRCSGPQGETGCLNCKNAGSSECQFNRVASEEIPFRDPASVFFPYNTNIARDVQVRQMPAAIYGSSYPSMMVPLNVSLAYRNHPLANYGYQSKSECYIPTYGTEFTDESIDYGLSGSPYPLMAQDQVAISSAYSSNSLPRGWNASTSQPTKGSSDPMYFHSDTAPSYHGMPYQAQNYSMRHSVSADSANFSFQNMASSLPITSALTNSTSDRVLPVPSANSVSRSNSESNSSALVSLATSADGLPYSVPSLKNGNSVLPSSSTYMSLSSSPDSVPSYGGHILIAQSQDLYTPNGGEDWSPKTQQAEPILRSQDSSSELYYTATTESRKGSQSGQNSAASTLANGQVYHPYHQEHLIARKPSIDGAQIATLRHSNTCLRAA